MGTRNPSEGGAEFWTGNEWRGAEGTAFGR
jgi:hypothetical protein